MKKPIYSIWNADIKVCETSDKKEIEFYEAKGYRVIKTGSYAIERQAR